MKKFPIVCVVGLTLRRISTEAAKGVIALVAVSGSILLGANAANADAIVSTSGDLVLIPKPAMFNYNNGTGFSGAANPNPIIFNVSPDYVIPTFSALDPSVLAPYHLTPSQFIGLDYLPVDISGPGTYPGNALTGGEIASGTEVSTYIINFEPSDTNPVGSSTGSVTFSQNVLGIALNGSDFDLVRYQLIAPYLNPSTGFELCTGDPICDVVSLSADRRTVSFVSNVDGSTDDMLIFVAPDQVPEPDSVALFAAGVGVFWFARRRKQKYPI